MRISDHKAAALVAVLAVSLMSSTARAQDARTVDDVEKIDSAAPADSSLSAPGGVQLLTEDGQTKVVLKYGFKRSTSDNAGNLYFETLSIGGELPAGKSDNSAAPMRLDGIPGGSSFTLNYRRLVNKTKFGGVDPESEAALRCEDAKAISKAKHPNLEAKEFSSCTGFLEKYFPSEAPRLLQMLAVPDGPITYWGFTGKIEAKDFKFVDPVRVAMSTQSENPWSVGIYYTRAVQGPDTVLTFDAKYREDFEDQKSGERCPTGVSSGPTCLTGALGRPKAVTRGLLSIEARRNMGSFAIAATGTYDTNNNLYAFEVPIYLVPGEKGALSGGIKFGWRSDTKDVTAGVFMGRTFDATKF